jgi:hypothetical protein
VRVISNSFDPPTLTVKAGTTVEWTWESGIHNVVSGTNCTPDSKFSSGAAVSPPKSFTFNAADLTFASLSAPMLAPDGYRGNLGSPEGLPDAFLSEVATLRETPAGKFTQRMYKEQR